MIAKLPLRHLVSFLNPLPIHLLDICYTIFYPSLTMPPDPAAKKDFFISYNRADRAWAEWIAWQLEAAGFSVIIQAWDFRPGMNFMAEMHQALTIAHRFIGVLSPHYLSAPYAQQELMAALAKDPLGQQGTVVLTKVRPCELTGLLPVIIHIDIVGLEEEPAKDKLLAGVRFERAKPLTKPPFPISTANISLRFPGRVPAIWNVPHPRNPNFTGREDLLTALHTALNKEGASVLTQTLHGLGGVGKTQTALEYAYRYGFEYDLVWWLGAEEPVKLAADYASLAARLNLPEKDLPDQPAVIASVKDWLRQNQNWLLVFDNAREPGEIKPFLPSGGNGHVLVTSRNLNWGALAATQPVPLLPRDQAVAFLLKRTGQEDANTAHKLSHELGDLPLALEQAGAYIAASGITLSEYLELFQTRRRDLWGEETSPDNYDHTVAATWSLSLENAEKEAPGAAALLNLCAFLAPDAIPRSLLETKKDFLPSDLNRLAADSLARNKVFTALRFYSLLEVAPDTLAIHRLVQVVIRDHLDDGGSKQWTGATVELVNAAFPFDCDDFRTWDDCARLLPHALAAAGHAENIKVSFEAAGHLLNQAGVYLRNRADFMGARIVHERCLYITEKAFGPNHPNMSCAFNNLGLVLKTNGKLPAAKTALLRALAIQENLFPFDQPNLVVVLNNLGSVFRDMGDLPAAKAHLQRALTIAEKIYGPDHPSIAIGVANLGLVLQDLRDLPAAKAAFERALAIDERIYDPDHPEVATDVNNLGSVFHDMGDLPAAKVHYERALNITEKIYGPDHPNVAAGVNNLGSVFHDMGDLPAAKAQYHRALTIAEKVLGPDHPKTKLVRDNLASLDQ